jgi:hypothetical protein
MFWTPLPGISKNSSGHSIFTGMIITMIDPMNHFRMFFITELLAGLPVGLKEISDGLWQLQFSFYVLGSVDLRKNKIIRN